MKKSIFKTFAVVLTVAMLVSFSSITAFAEFGSGDFFETYSAIPNSEDNGGFWFDVEDLIDETTGAPVLDGDSMRGHPYVDYLRNHGTPKNIDGTDHSPYYGVEDDGENTFMNLNPGSYYVADHPFEESYHATVDLKLDAAFAASTFAAIRFNVDNDAAATLIGSTEIGLNVALDAADDSKDTVSIGVDGAYYVVSLPNGALSTWKTFQILDNNAGLMKIYYDNCLIATVELSDAKGGEYKTVVVKDANGTEKAKKTDASVSANYNNMNFGVAQNADKTTVPEGGMHVDNWGIVPYTFDASKNNPLPDTQTGIGGNEQPSTPADPTEKPADPTEKPSEEPTEKPADPTQKPSTPSEKPSDKPEDQVPTGDVVSLILIVAAAALVVTVLAKKKAY